MCFCECLFNLKKNRNLSNRDNLLSRQDCVFKIAVSWAKVKVQQVDHLRCRRLIKAWSLATYGSLNSSWVILECRTKNKTWAQLCITFKAKIFVRHLNPTTFCQVSEEPRSWKNLTNSHWMVGNCHISEWHPYQMPACQLSEWVSGEGIKHQKAPTLTQSSRRQLYFHNFNGYCCPKNFKIFVGTDDKNAQGFHGKMPVL